MKKKFIDYQDIITLYNSKGLDTSSLKRKLEISKPLNASKKYETLEYSDNYAVFYIDIRNILVMMSRKNKIEDFYEDVKYRVTDYYEKLIKRIKRQKAWTIMKVNAKEHTLDKFTSLKLPEKIKEAIEINKSYRNFLEYQNIADIKEHLCGKKDELSEDELQKIQFLQNMFDNMKNPEVKREFFCFDQDFLKALITFKKSKKTTLDKFMEEQKKSVKQDYKKFSHYFTTEDYRDIIECLTKTSKTLKCSIKSVIEAFSVFSESKEKICYLKEEQEMLEDLYAKYQEIAKVLLEKITQKNKVSQKDGEKKVIQSRMPVMKSRNLKENTLEKVSTGSNTLEEKQYQNKLRNMHNVKEKVKPLLFSWLEREDMTLTRRVGNKNLVAFFEKIKQIEAKTGARVSLFLVTNASKEVTLKRLQDFQKKARTHGLPRLVEGALGGYGSFRISKDGKFTDISKMSELNRNRIIRLFNSKILINGDSEELVVPEETNYVRYQFSDKKDKSITIKWLKYIKDGLLKDPKIKKQPIAILPFIEGRYSGMDIVLGSQLEAIRNLPMFYEQNFYVVPGKILKANSTSLQDFLENNEEKQVKKVEEDIQK